MLHCCLFVSVLKLISVISRVNVLHFLPSLLIKLPCLEIQQLNRCLPVLLAIVMGPSEYST